MVAPSFLEFDDVLQRMLGDLRGLSVLDIGAGTGRVTRQLASLGADVVGVEPNPAQVARAEAQVEGRRLRYVRASATETGLDDESVDIALFSLSLHHIDDMAAGLREACRVTRPGGRIVVIEPVAPDPLFPVMRFIDDESAVYAEAQAALGEAQAAGALAPQDSLLFADKYRVDTAAEMIDDLVTIDSGRRLAESDREAFEAAFLRARRQDAAGGYLPYWSRFDVFIRRPDDGIC